MVDEIEKFVTAGASVLLRSRRDEIERHRVFEAARVERMMDAMSRGERCLLVDGDLAYGQRHGYVGLTGQSSVWDLYVIGTDDAGGSYVGGFCLRHPSLASRIMAALSSWNENQDNAGHLHRSSDAGSHPRES